MDSEGARYDWGQLQAVIARLSGPALSSSQVEALIDELLALAKKLERPEIGDIASRLRTSDGQLAKEEIAALTSLQRDAEANAESDVHDQGWDAETAELLQNLFADEAREHLEVMSRAAMLLSADPDSLKEILRRAHTLKGAAATVGRKEIGEAAHLLEERCVELQSSGADRVQVQLWLVRVLDALAELIQSSRSLSSFRRVVRRHPGATARKAKSDKEPQETTRPPRLRPLGEQRNIERRVLTDRRVDGSHMLRVDVDRVEELMNAVGQLVINRTRIERQVEELRGLSRDLLISNQALRSSVVELAGAHGGSEAVTRVGEVEVEVADTVGNLEGVAEALMEESDGLGRTTRVLREHLTSVRMMPIRWLYARLQRPMRELAAAEGKRVELVTEGESTEIDRSVAERISDPLIHLVRNAIAHGIEPASRRRELGKPEVGRVTVTARHQGDMFFLEVADDGAGIDDQAVRETAGRQGIEVGDDPLPLIFSSGFTTRPAADGLAGRGVGLDVVRQNVGRLSGDVRVSSSRGQGTRFSIRLPMTTAISQALLLKQGENVYAIPVVYVCGTHLVGADRIANEGGVGRLAIRGGQIPLLRLDRLLGEKPRQISGNEQVVELGFGEQRFAITCGRLLGPREIVLKRLGPLLGPIPLFAGAAVSGSGSVQLVLDVAALAEMTTEGASVVARRPVRPTLLVADDSRSVRHVVARILRDAGYTVETVSDGWDAWERLKRERFALLVTDLEMPRINGYDLITRCRNSEHDWLQGLPILVLTSRTAEAKLATARERGADCCIKKPVDRRLIIDAIESLLERGDYLIGSR